MSRVLIISDSHGLTAEIEGIKNRHQADVMIHCGDSELDLDATELNGFLKVAGNCDIDSRYPNEQTPVIGGLTFYVTHGHLDNVKSNLSTLSYRAAEKDAQIICYGHTHIAGAEQIDGQLFINPGSIRLPRNRVEKTYAIMEWESSDNIIVAFHTVSGKKVEELTYRASL
ncbi:metallophosphoesterase [Virgibacillus sp. C22-A2]|uniref:Phosphoesterase n=1 Tax=Virgibacillus tibetensis TaxID=3042313 RepID=A0ABU6KC24_9BACI|nr:metallophosphoesterase [Virgibacillus sp. C22-A2]